MGCDIQWERGVVLWVASMIYGEGRIEIEIGIEGR